MNSAKKRYVVDGATMAYLEAGEGDPIIFLHGNPASSYIWRNILPTVAAFGRCIAPDLIGMGDSDKLSPSGPDRYRFVEHRRYLDALLDGLGVSDRVIVVGQDWGSALGFDWARRNPEKLRGLVHMESIVRPWTPGWAEGAKFPMQHSLDAFLALRSAAGEELILEKNMFVENIVVDGTQRRLTDAELNEYRRPFARVGEDRRPTLTWPREIPYEGTPADVDEIVSAYADWLPTSSVPKLFINADPGYILDDSARNWCRTWANQTEVTVPGKHFVQEDSPEEIAQAIIAWLQGLD